MINITNETWTIRITDDVFTNLAGDAATSCFGVKGMAGRSKDGGPLPLLRRESMSKGVAARDREWGRGPSDRPPSSLPPGRTQARFLSVLPKISFWPADLHPCLTWVN